jgi:transposase-like protein
MEKEKINPRLLMKPEIAAKFDALDLKPIRGVRGCSTFTAEESATILNFMNEHHVSIAKIARHMDICYMVMRSSLNRHHKYSRKWTSVATPEVGMEIVRRFRLGNPCRSIRKALGVTKGQVYYWLREYKKNPHRFSEYENV